MIIDSHAHLDMTKGGRAELEAELERAWRAGLSAIVTIAGATKPGEYGETFGNLP